ncbi:alpha-(1,3)-fucosyltransferase 9-like [Cottoperca gobio]|uniref:Fucosyltransferase n=1 Tax=Cottoperca gobio TaxID=56716 RepID=A0A6J2S907_COTGO|nr:alpha-(1,3)-fucosyltransferase 9-like [Cottoperca gobio]XP_029318251.1 alpha-(1,3)-fucosyltransferase 9-like [Cottoperca gobio]XP_029318252.1 alpha-(1,3)-fucosyltransferase 9-like [Cottoperca gobio]
MSSSACQWISPRSIFCSSLLVLCFLSIFLIYYNPDFNYANVGSYLERGRQFCPTMLCTEKAQTQDSDQNSPTELHPHPSDTQENQTIAVDAEPDTILLIWMWPFGYRFDLSCNIFNITRCRLTDDKTLYHKAHGVFFHHRDINYNLVNMPKEPRPSFQKWVWSNMESPANAGQIPKLNDLFNLTCTYRLDSNIPVPYGYQMPLTSKEESFKLPAKDKLVCWIVSNLNANHERVKFYNELKKYIKIHAYGKGFGQRISDEDYSKIVSSCKFYLSFENSIYKDYITEKLYKPMMKGSVPIVLGPSRPSYENHIRADSFIHVNDFSSPKELADRLLYLDQNNSEYMRYFTWTSKFKVRTIHFGKEHACKTCSYLQKHREYQAVHDLNKWYWG